MLGSKGRRRKNALCVHFCSVLWRFYTILALMPALLRAQPGPAVRINEVAPGEQGRPDWVELFNPGGRKIDLQGMAFVSGDALHRITGPLLVAPGGFAVLWFGSDSTGVRHVPFRLSRKGDALVLVAPDRKRVLDVFTWPDLPPGLSIGRCPDGGPHWGYTTEPTPGRAATEGHYASRVLPPPRPVLADGLIDWRAEALAELRYTLDGSTPDSNDRQWTGAMRPPGTGVITVRAFAPDAIASPAAAYPPPDTEALLSVSLRVDPLDLMDSLRGILVEGRSANFSQRGRAWERPADLALHLADTVLILPVDLWVAGSGSRGLPKKNLKLRLRGDPDTSALPESLRGVSEWMLRADATPGAFLNDHFVERLAAAHAAVEVQASLPLPLLINGTYQGLYRLMPAKNSDLVLRLTDAEAVDLVHGPAGEVLRGDRKAYARWMDLLTGDAPLTELERHADMASLLDMACLDLWTGRGDAELNTRCWRPKVSGGRWRWMAYDMDLWAPPSDNTVARLMAEPRAAAPHLAALLANTERTNALLARVTAWNAAGLWDVEASTLLTDLYDRHRTQLLRDHARWSSTMPMEHPDTAFARLERHLSVRATRLLSDLAAATGRSLVQVAMRVEPPQAGELQVEGRYVTDARHTFTAFTEAPLRVEAIAAEGYRFAGWRHRPGMKAGLLFTPDRSRELVAVFRKVDGSGRDALEQ